tara:strand:+ start:192 stop:1502 length:1311 start_codon:yes stop_codon:yes gene_type:complete
MAESVNYPGGSETSWTAMSYNGTKIKKGDYFISDDGRRFVMQYNESIGSGGNYSPGTLWKWVEVKNKKGIDKLTYNPDYTLIANFGPEIEKEAVIRIDSGPIGGQFNKAAAHRWPLDMIDEETDWVLFQFGKYPKPFGRDAAEAVNITGKKNQITFAKGLVSGTNQYGLDNYNMSAAALEVNGPPVMLPVPQDVANEIQQTWQGKQFTALGRAAIAAGAAGRFSDGKQVLKDVAGNLVGLQTSLTAMALNTLPGVGGNISFNDLAGSTRGVVINPNAEMLYDSPQMREVGMVFKMVASNSEESAQIQNIYNTFRRNASPQYGGTDNADSEEWQKTREQFVKWSKGKEDNSDGKNDWGDMHNFIRVPNLCKFTFMKGHSPHPWLIQFKPCAISNVEVNYTPDGTYATHPDGAPVAVEIRLSFMETKVVFAQEIGQGF